MCIAVSFPNNKIEGQEIKLDDSYNVKVMEFPGHITHDKSCLETDNKEPQHNEQEQEQKDRRRLPG